MCCSFGRVLDAERPHYTPLEVTKSFRSKNDSWGYPQLEIKWGGGI